MLPFVDKETDLMEKSFAMTTPSSRLRWIQLETAHSTQRARNFMFCTTFVPCFLQSYCCTRAPVSIFEALISNFVHQIIDTCFLLSQIPRFQAESFRVWISQATTVRHRVVTENGKFWQKIIYLGSTLDNTFDAALQNALSRD